MSSCRGRKKVGSLAELGVPDEHTWEGLPEERIQEYLQAKEKVIEELQKAEGSIILPHDPTWIHRISPQSKEMLKGLLLRRAVGLVHVLKPIEEQRRAMRMLQSKGYLPPNHMATFERAEEQCGKELQAVMEESQVLAPEMPPNAIIQSAVQAYHQYGGGRPSSADASDDADDGKSFEDVKRGFLKNKTTNKADKSFAHGFPIGAEVEAHSLQTEALNGARGLVKGEKGERVAVAFPDGEKALKPANLRLVPPMPPIHPDARETPKSQLQISLTHEKGESLGLALSHEPPLEMQKPGHESCLLIKDILPDGYVKRYNASQQDPEVRLYKGDRIVAVIDGSLPEEKRMPVGGNSKLIMEIISSGRTPLVFFVVRVLGPPLRFKVGQQVRANCGQKGWQAGSIVKVWDEHKSNGARIPYVIRKNGTNDYVVAPVDGDDYVVKGDPRFKKGDDIMFNKEGSYCKGQISEVREEQLSNGYSITVKGEKRVWTAPEDLDVFVRPIARYKKGTKVLAKVNDEYVPGTIESLYHPNWVYSVRLDAGNVVYVPRDEDIFMKKR